MLLEHAFVFGIQLATVRISQALQYDPQQANQQRRSNNLLPHGYNPRPPTRRGLSVLGQICPQRVGADPVFELSLQCKCQRWNWTKLRTMVRCVIKLSTWSYV